MSVIKGNAVWVAQHQDFYQRALREALASMPEKQVLETIGRIQSGDYQLWNILEDVETADEDEQLQMHMLGFAVTRFQKDDKGRPVMVLAALWKLPNITMTDKAWRTVAEYAAKQAREAGCVAITTCVYHEHTKRLSESLGFQWDVIQMRRDI